MKEISNKLAHELREMLMELESYLDDQYFKYLKIENEEISAERIEWGTAQQMCFNIKGHLFRHMQDMIEHPDFNHKEER